MKLPECGSLWITYPILLRPYVCHNGTMKNDILAGLDETQRSAALASDGPVRIIAGAGAGKTRTIMRRIAYACESSRGSMQWDPKKVLAVTFSTKAAQEMQGRLAQLGVQGVHAATFHSAALQQLRSVWHSLSDSPFPQVCENTKDLVFRALVRATGTDAYQDIEVSDAQAEIDWAKVSMVAPSDYGSACQVSGRTPPLGMDPSVMKRVMECYEEEKAFRNEIDFNDILLMLCHILDEDAEQARTVRSGIGWLTVDEYQDVSPLQHRLTELWLGDNRNICVVGDPAQTIYSFAGATSYYLTGFAREFGGLAADIELATDYRSTQNIVKEANKILKHSPMRDTYLQLASARETGKRVSRRVYGDDRDEARGIVSKIKDRISHGVRAEDIAVLMRINSQGILLARLLNEEKIAYRVRTESGWTSNASHDSLMNSDGTVGQVSLSTIHAAKGLEWKHVFIMGCSEGLIPFLSNQEDGNLEEERRLLYVGITRAEDELEISYARAVHKDDVAASRYSAERRPSRFLT